MDFKTLAVHAGSFTDETAGAVVNPIYLSTTYERNQAGEIAPKGYVYSRHANPNRGALEKLVAALEGGSESFAFSSGMAATMAVFQTVLSPGSHIIVSDDCYHGVTHLLTTQYPRWGVTCSAVDMTDVKNIEAAIRKETALILAETPSNPLLKIADLEGVGAIGKKHRILTACDNTWATPYHTRPLQLGIDLVIHSSTKYFGGHSDVLSGMVVAASGLEISERLRDFQAVGGAVPSPFECWLLTRSIATMPLRVRQQSASAAVIAEALSVHPAVERVYYPGLSGHINHAVAASQMKNGFGGMVSIQVSGGRAAALAFTGKLKIFRHATSLGGVESLIEHRLTAEGAHPKSPENLLRISIGVEDTQDLLSDLLQGLG